MFPDNFKLTFHWDVESSVYFALALAGALFIAGMGVVLGIRLILKD